MKVDQLKAMMELKAVQNFGTSSSDITDGSTFQDILNQILTDDEVSALSEPLTNTPTKETNSVPVTSLPPLSLLKTSNNIDNIINQASQQYGIPAKLIKAVIQQESGFNANAKSMAGASGLMQLMPGTAKSLGVTDVFDPEQNVLAGSKYLKQLLINTTEKLSWHSQPTMRDPLMSTNTEEFLLLMRLRIMYET